MNEHARSIGPIGCTAYEMRNDRTRGTLVEIAASAQDIHALLMQTVMEARYGTRLAVRVLVGKGVDPNVSRVSWKTFPVSLEAFIPVRGHPKVAGIACYGANDNMRIPSDGVRHGERALYGRVMEMPWKPVRDIEVEILSAHRVTAPDIQQLADLYHGSFSGYPDEFGVNAVREIVETSMVVIARGEEGEIISACAAEIADMPLTGTLPLRLVEITHEATLRTHRDHGFATAVKQFAIERMRAGSDPIPTVITTEARANSARALRSNLKLGLTYAGYLPMHGVLQSVQDEEVAQDNRYGNLAAFCAS